MGKRLFKLIIVSTNERGRPSDVSGGKKLLRQLFVWFIAPIEFFILLFSGKTLGDMLAETLVIPEKDFDDYCAEFEKAYGQNQFYAEQPRGNAPYQNTKYGNYYQQNVSSEPKVKRDIDPALLSDNYSPLYDFPIAEPAEQSGKFEQTEQDAQTEKVNSENSETENNVKSENTASQVQDFENPT